MGLFGGGGGFDADKLIKTDARSLSLNYMPMISRMGRSLQREQLNKALAVSRGTMSPTDLPEFMRARQLQEAGSQRALADVADRMTQLGVSGPAAAAVLDRQRQSGASSNLQLAQSFGDAGEARIGQGIDMGNKAISFGLQSAGIQASADANYNTAQMAAEASGGGGGAGIGGILSGAMSGAGTGAMIGGPWGALAGGLAGGAMGAFSGGGKGGGSAGGGGGGFQAASDAGADTGMGMGMIMEMMKKYFGQKQSYSYSGYGGRPTNPNF
jgi:hypothetical protein